MSVVWELPSHPRENCPASTKECAKCHKREHYARVCCSTQTQAAREVTQSADELTEDLTADFGGIFLGELSEAETTARDTPWLAPLRIGPVPVVFKIDTGADVPANPQSLYQMAFRVPLFKSSPLWATPSQLLADLTTPFIASIARVSCSDHLSIATTFVARTNSSVKLPLRSDHLLNATDALAVFGILAYCLTCVLRSFLLLNVMCKPYCYGWSFCSDQTCVRLADA